MRVLIRQQPTEKCVPCIKAFANFQAFSAELRGPEFGVSPASLQEDVETMEKAVNQLAGCVDESKRQEALKGLENLPERPDSDRILEAVAPLDVYDMANQIASRCCS